MRERRLPRRLAAAPIPKRCRFAARGRACRQARGGAACRPATARQAWDRPYRPGYPPRPRGGAAQAARAAGRRPPGGADHRRLHRPRGRPLRALGAAADAERAADRRQRRDLPRAGAAHPRPRSGAPGGALQRRVAGHADGRAAAAGWHYHRGAAARTRRLRPALLRVAPRSRCSSCSTRCCRGTTPWRSAPTWSSVAPTRSSTCCWGATSSAPTASPRRRSSRCRCWSASKGGARCPSRWATTSASPSRPRRSTARR